MKLGLFLNTLEGLTTKKERKPSSDLNESVDTPKTNDGLLRTGVPSVSIPKRYSSSIINK